MKQKENESSNVQPDLPKNPSPQQQQQRIVSYAYAPGVVGFSFEERKQNPEENSSLDVSQSLCTPSCQLF